MFQNILVALDGSVAAETILPHVEALAKKFGSAVTLIGATESTEMIVAETAPMIAEPEPPMITDPGPIIDHEHQSAESYLARVAARLRALGLVVAYEDPEGPPATVIIELAERINADLIAMTTHGRGGIGRLVFGSVSDEVVRATPCPVLLVRLDEHELAPSGTLEVAEEANPHPETMTAIPA